MKLCRNGIGLHRVIFFRIPDIDRKRTAVAEGNVVSLNETDVPGPRAVVLNPKKDDSPKLTTVGPPEESNRPPLVPIPTLTLEAGQTQEIPQAT